MRGFSPPHPHILPAEPAGSHGPEINLSSTVPKMATNFFSGRRNISWVTCGTQIFFFLTLGITECIPIALMAYDRYIAICNLLRYALITSQKVCLQMAAIPWAVGACISFAHTLPRISPIVVPERFPIFSVRSWPS